ncbi:BnaC03g48500D [Brassica napus]|uniref:BnaC03g48500D protein n=1 Tax=Brassica napus TaxID=3708 RepID=A0A078HFC2_BRANA|nr:BnaC03g48500D [Brassica napus]
MDHLKKQYDVYKRITRNATGLGFNESGEINMTADWWNELRKGCPEASKLRAHPLKDIPLLDRLYARVTVSVKEGWQPRAGPSKLRDAPNPFTQVIESDEEVEPAEPIGKSGPRGKGKAVASRKQVNPDKWERLTTAIENQGKFWNL